MATSTSLPYNTLVEMLQYYHDHDSSRLAFSFTDKDGDRFQLTFGQVHTLGGRWANVLHEQGVEQGWRVVNTLVNSPERVLTDVGIAMAGAVIVNAQCQLADGSDMLHTLRKAEAQAVCINPDLEWGPWSVLQQHVQRDPLNHSVTSDSLPALRKIFFIRRASPLNPTAKLQSQTAAPEDMYSQEEESLENFVADVHRDFIKGLQVSDGFFQAEAAPHDMMVVFNTSGSTGFSKLVPFSHSTLIVGYTLLSGGSTDFDLSFSCSPLGWSGGFTFMQMALGRGRVLLDMWRGSPDNLTAFLWNMIAREKCSQAVLMSYIIPQILELKDRQAWKLKSLLMGGQPLKRVSMSNALLLAESVLVVYASTEMFIATCKFLTSSCRHEDFQVGQPLPSTTVKICDADGRELAPGTKGEVWIKTPYMATQYLNSPEETKAAFTEDGFWRSGDVGLLQQDGELLVEGRLGDAIHRGSFIFYPGWLESRILHCCPGVQDVLVVGVPDLAMGQEICACFVPSHPSMNEERLRRQVEKDIKASLKDPLSPRPRYYLSFPEFPRTFTDKPRRQAVQLLAADRLALM